MRTSHYSEPACDVTAGTMQQEIEIKVFATVASFPPEQQHAWLSTIDASYSSSTHRLRVRAPVYGLVATMPRLLHSDRMPKNLRYYSSGLKRIVSAAGGAEGLTYEDRENWEKVLSQDQQPLPGVSLSIEQVQDLKLRALQQQVSIKCSRSYVAAAAADTPISHAAGSAVQRRAHGPKGAGAMPHLGVCVPTRVPGRVLGAAGAPSDCAFDGRGKKPAGEVQLSLYHCPWRCVSCWHPAGLVSLVRACLHQHAAMSWPCNISCRIHLTTLPAHADCCSAHMSGNLNALTVGAGARGRSQWHGAWRRHPVAAAAAAAWQPFGGYIGSSASGGQPWPRGQPGCQQAPAVQCSQLGGPRAVWKWFQQAAARPAGPSRSWDSQQRSCSGPARVAGACRGIQCWP
jgi:hypothetical protein